MDAVKNIDTKKLKIFGIIAGVILLILIAIYFIGVHKGKKGITIQSLPGQLPGDPSGNNQLGASNDELKMLAEKLYNDMNGFNWAGHDLDLYQQALALEDADLIKLYNAFNTEYQTDSGQTLTQWINSEDFAITDIPDALRAKLAKLNLK